MNFLEILQSSNQSLWLDNIQKDFLMDGSLKKAIEEMGVKGLTSNPTIFENALLKSKAYDASIIKLAKLNISAEAIFENLMIEDIKKAADILSDVYKKSEYTDGYVSMEIPPLYADDYEKTIEEAEKLWERTKRENLMIKVPATIEGVRAIKHLLSRGINVNATLIFSVERYQEVMAAYLQALQYRTSNNLPISKLASVASFFVSRIDTHIDKLLDKISKKNKTAREKAKRLKGKTAIANCLLTYEKYKAFFSSPEFLALKDKGARAQRLLWASTGTKNPDYKDTLYIDELALPETVNTLPVSTLEAFINHGTVNKEKIELRVAEAEKILIKLRDMGVNLETIFNTLEQEGVKKFIRSYNHVVRYVLVKTQALSSAIRGNMSKYSGANISEIISSAKHLKKINFPKRLWLKDASLWKDDINHKTMIENFLGWLDIPYKMRDKVGEIEQFAKEVSSFSHAVLLGMGGSSLAPKVFSSIFQKAKNPKLIVLDTIDPAQIETVTNSINIKKTLFIFSSKSGGTIEPNSQFKHFFNLLLKNKIENPGSHFVAITDKGSSLEKLGEAKNFRKIFINPSDIGGRFSALSYFGLVPAAICGADIKTVIDGAVNMANLCKTSEIKQNPGAMLGAIIAGAWDLRRDKLTIITHAKISSFTLWIEQLVAESLGKEGKGVVPICQEEISQPEKYQADRFFIHIKLTELLDKSISRGLSCLAKAGQPVLETRVENLNDIGAEFMRWEIATAAAGAIMRINPFDQPNVQDAKLLAGKLLETIKKTGELKTRNPDYSGKFFDAFLSPEIKTLNSNEKTGNSGDALERFFSAVKGKEYIGILPYLPYDKKIDSLLRKLRIAVKDRSFSATLFGYGPRYLHSSGQLHKGGADNGVFLILTNRPKKDIIIAGESYTFGQLEMAQAIGDFNALEAKKRRALWIDLKCPADKSLTHVLNMISKPKKLKKKSQKIMEGKKMLRLSVKNRNTNTKKTTTTTVRNTDKTVRPVNTKTTTNKTEYVVIDYPKNLETINSWHYAVRIGTGLNCEKVDISIDDKPWQTCRYSDGYWWYDWTNYTPGTHQLTARMTKTNGQYIISTKRRCKIV
ncbi:MAG: bifunctional transaldolase/phosoglucose isomerase [Elusimicrobia bacterium]|nr:bifunctional transaldolase/phosoglucose isomerase [Elusimicrobiota bacterium]